MTAAERGHQTVHRYYRLKARLLGSTLYDYDRYAPLFADLPACDWRPAGGSSRRATRRSAPRPGRSSASSSTSAGSTPNCDPASAAAPSQRRRPSVHPYILMNFTDKLRDVMTLAHELGHGLHQYLAAGRLFPVRHALDDGRDGQRLRRDADLPPLAGAVPGAADAAGPAVQQDRGRLRHRLPPGGPDALRAGPAQGRAGAGRTDDGADQRLWLDANRPCTARRSR